nr:retrovirus-related Pol polyprotein from transposon TNT 1-94 [Tanacetum cinerariifolium]
MELELEQTQQDSIHEVLGSTRFYWLSHSEIVDIEKVAVHSSLNIKQLCGLVWGCDNYLSKFDPKSYKGVFLGYSQNSKACIVLNKHTMKVKESLNVTFDETPPTSKTSPLVDDDLDEEEEIKVIEKKNLENDIVDETLEINEIVNIKESRNHPLENVIGNINQITLRSQAQNKSNFFYFISTIEPKNVNEALGDESWIVAMQEELNQFVANNVWELVPQPKNMTIIGTKWVFKNKLDENGIVSRNTTRLVAQGYNQQEGIGYDETYAPESEGEDEVESTPEIERKTVSSSVDKARCKYHQTERMVNRTNHSRIYHSANTVPKAVLTRSGLKPVNSVRHVNLVTDINKRTKSKLKPDKTEHEMESAEKSKFNQKPRVDPTLLNDFEMATDENGDPPIPDLQTMEELCQPTLNGRATVGQTQNVYAAGAYNQDELKNMFGQFMKMNTASSSGSETHPSNTITNPKEDLKGITTRSGNTYQGLTIPTTSSLPKVVECETDAIKDTVPPTNNGSTKDVQPLVVQIETPIPNSEPVVAPVSALKPNQKSSIPYPSRLHDQKLRDKTNDQKVKFFQLFKDLDFNISFADALILMPKFGPTIKSLLTNKD